MAYSVYKPADCHLSKYHAKQNQWYWPIQQYNKWIMTKMTRSKPLWQAPMLKMMHDSACQNSPCYSFIISCPWSGMLSMQLLYFFFNILSTMMRNPQVNATFCPCSININPYFDTNYGAQHENNNYLTQPLQTTVMIHLPTSHHSLFAPLLKGLVVTSLV